MIMHLQPSILIPSWTKSGTVHESVTYKRPNIRLTIDLSVVIINLSSLITQLLKSNIKTPAMETRK